MLLIDDLPDWVEEQFSAKIMKLPEHLTRAVYNCEVLKAHMHADRRERRKGGTYRWQRSVQSHRPVQIRPEK